MTTRNMKMTPDDRRRWLHLRRRFARAALRGDARAAHAYGLQLSQHAAGRIGSDYLHWMRLVSLFDAGKPIPEEWMRDLAMVAGRIH